MSNEKILDVAIIGGGVGGVYTAFRLQEKYDPSSMAVFEMSDRIGGRLYSVNLPGMPHLKTEIGGMRIMDEQKIVMDLVKNLGLKMLPFPMGADTNLAYLRGKRFQVKDYSDPSMVPYNLPPSERGMSPSQLVVTAIETIIPGASKMNTEQLRAAAYGTEINGIPLRNYGFWSMLLEKLGIEGYNLVRMGGGFYTVESNWNCAEAIVYFMADWSSNPSATQYYTLEEGYQSLPLTLCQKFKDAGGKVCMEHRLLHFSKEPDNTMTLTFDNGKGGGEKLALPSPGAWPARIESDFLGMARITFLAR